MGSVHKAYISQTPIESNTCPYFLISDLIALSQIFSHKKDKSEKGKKQLAAQNSYQTEEKDNTISCDFHLANGQRTPAYTS